MKTKFLLALCLGFANVIAVAQPVGRVLVAVGDVTVQRSGRDLVLASGAELFAGDTVRVGDVSNAQIGFTDTSIVALRSKSMFRIDEYAFEPSNESQLSKAVFSLLRGGLRTLTGVIGRTNRDGYRMRAQAATVGIRGTHYTLVVCQQDCNNIDGTIAVDGTYGGVLEGRVALANAAGEREFGADEYFYVADATTLPQQLIGRPGFLRDRLEARARRDQRQNQANATGRPDGRDDRDESARMSKTEAMARLDARNDNAGRPSANTLSAIALLGQNGNINVTDLRDSSGNVAVLGPGLGLSVSYSTATAARSTTDGGTGTAIIVNAAENAVDSFRLLNGEITGTRNRAVVADAGRVAGDGNIFYGRWTQGSTVTVDGSTFTPPTGVHFVVGALTPPDVLSKPLATIGVSASAYDIVGSTRPSDGSGQSGQFLGGVFNVDFLARTISGGVSYKIGNVTFALPVPTGTGLLARPGVVGFLVTPRNGGQWTCATCNTTSGSIDSYAISGLFLGSRAQNLGVTFATLDAATGRTAGAAVFRCRGCKP